MLLDQVGKNWWVFVLRGVLAVLFGVFTFINPAVSLASLILVYGAYALIDGVTSAIGAFANRRQGSGFPWSVLLIGLIGIATGVVTFMYPGLTALVLLYFIAAWFIVRGIFEIVLAIQLRKEIEGEFWLGLAGLLSVLFGVLLFARPGVGALAVLWMIGIFAILMGIMFILLGFKLKGLRTA
jgi:uncharacterized membrane protein HdeD (DUF308 family)